MKFLQLPNEPSMTWSGLTWSFMAASKISKSCKNNQLQNTIKTFQIYNTLCSFPVKHIQKNFDFLRIRLSCTLFKIHFSSFCIEHQINEYDFHKLEWSLMHLENLRSKKFKNLVCSCSFRYYYGTSNRTV